MNQITAPSPTERLRQAADRLDELADAGPDAMRHFGQTLDSTVGKALAAWLRDFAPYANEALDGHLALAVADAILGGAA